MSTRTALASAGCTTAGSFVSLLLLKSRVASLLLLKPHSSPGQPRWTVCHSGDRRRAKARMVGRQPSRWAAQGHRLTCVRRCSRRSARIRQNLMPRGSWMQLGSFFRTGAVYKGSPVSALHCPAPHDKPRRHKQLHAKEAVEGRIKQNGSGSSTMNLAPQQAAHLCGMISERGGHSPASPAPFHTVGAPQLFDPSLRIATGTRSDRGFTATALQLNPSPRLWRAP